MEFVLIQNYAKKSPNHMLTIFVMYFVNETRKSLKNTF
jgi:hypothetical protein